MAGNAETRETHRDYLLSLLQAKLGSGDLNLVADAAFYNHKAGDLQKQSPALVVSSAGTERERVQRGTDEWDTWIYLRIYVFVAYAIEGTEWGEDDAEDALDDIDKAIADVIMDNRSQAQNGSVPWDAIYFDGPSDANVDVIIGGDPYRREIIDVKARVLHG